MKHWVNYLRLCKKIFCILVDGGWAEWTEWATCSVTCGGGGSQSKSRTCTNPAPSHNGLACVGDEAQQQSCGNPPCPIDGQWTEWTEWSMCSVTCGGGGSQSKSRTCTNPAPSHNGLACVGDEAQQQSCGNPPCPIDGQWTEWTEWSMCSVTCGGGGSQSKSRTCTNPAPSHNGLACAGVITQQQSCGDALCPINGGWSEWRSWGPCSFTCGGGFQIRSRACTSPEPKNGGLDCVTLSGEIDTEQQVCHDHSCSDTYGWDEWSEWSACNVSCGEGRKTRSRHCHLKSDTSSSCEGDEMEFMKCDNDHCSAMIGWTSWTVWSVCDLSCQGTQNRFRQCLDNTTGNCDGEPSQYKMCNTSPNCKGEGTTDQPCNGPQCDPDLICYTQPCDGQWTQWFVVEPCPPICGTGFKVSNRTCTNSAGQDHSALNCHGNHSKRIDCSDIQPCSKNEGWSSWSDESECLTSCDTGLVVWPINLMTRFCLLLLFCVFGLVEYGDFHYLLVHVKLQSFNALTQGPILVSRFNDLL